jgi:hypothetical protein
MHSGNAAQGIRPNLLWQMGADGAEKRGWGVTLMGQDDKGNPVYDVTGAPPCRLVTSDPTVITVQKYYGCNSDEPKCGTESILKCPKGGYMDAIKVFYKTGDDEGRIWGFKFRCSFSVPDSKNQGKYKAMWQSACNDAQPSDGGTAELEKPDGFSSVSVNSSDDIRAVIFFNFKNLCQMWFGPTGGDFQPRYGRRYGRGQGIDFPLVKTTGHVITGFAVRCDTYSGIDSAYLRAMAAITAPFAQ